MQESEKVITVRNLKKVFRLKEKSAGLIGGFKNIFKPKFKTVKAVDGISFDVDKGEIIAFIGPNGAGKSTTIKMMTGILFPTSGSINVLGFDPTKQRQKLAFHIGSVFGQKSQLYMHLPPLDTYNLFSKIYELDQERYKERLAFLVKSFEIEHLLKTPVRKLSLGQRMRCEIVASLLHEPKIIFLDEPTIGLDVIAKQQIREVIRYLNEKEGVTIFLTSHDAGDIEALAERTIVINFGKIVFDDKTEKLKKQFIKTKTVELIVGKAIEPDKFKFKGGKVISQTKYSLNIELDVSKNSIDKLLTYAVDNFDIKDINIYDPAMEDIIADIYRSQK